MFFLDEPLLSDEEKARQMIERISGTADAAKFMQSVAPPAAQDMAEARQMVDRGGNLQGFDQWANRDMTEARQMMDRAGNLERFDQWAKKPTDYFGLGAPIQANYDLKKLEVPHIPMQSASMQPGGFLPDPGKGEIVGPSYPLPSASMQPSGILPNPAAGQAMTQFTPDKEFELTGPMPMPNFRQQGDVRIDTGFNNLGQAIFNQPAPNAPGAGYTYNDGQSIRPIAHSTDRSYVARETSPLAAMMQDVDPYAEPTKLLGYAGRTGMTAGVTDYSPVAASRSAMRNNLNIARMMGDQDIAARDNVAKLLGIQIGADARRDAMDERNQIMRERDASRFMQSLERLPEGQRTPFVQEGMAKGYMDPAVGKNMLLRENLLSAARQTKEGKTVNLKKFLPMIASGFDRQGLDRMTLVDELRKMGIDPVQVAAYENDPAVGEFVKSIIGPEEVTPGGMSIFGSTRPTTRRDYLPMMR